MNTDVLILGGVFAGTFTVALLAMIGVQRWLSRRFRDK